MQKRLGTAKFRRLHTPYLSLFRPKITKRKLQFALSDGILGGNHYFLFPYKKAHSVWEYDIYYLGSFMCFFIIISSSYGIQ